jgi:hypothetical protein
LFGIWGPLTLSLPMSITFFIVAALKSTIVPNVNNNKSAVVGANQISCLPTSFNHTFLSAKCQGSKPIIKCCIWKKKNRCFFYKRRISNTCYLNDGLKSGSVRIFTTI